MKERERDGGARGRVVERGGLREGGKVAI